MVTGTKQENLANTSYADRQLVVVLPDEVVEAARKAEAAAKTSKKSVDWPDIAVAVSRSLAGGLVSAVVELTAEALAAWASARERGLNIRQVGKSEVSQLVFPPGHPRTGVLYVGHPAMPNVYFTVASFHRVAFEHKFAEAVDLLMHLGASEIRVEHVRGWSREFAGRLSVPLPAKKNALSAESGSPRFQCNK